MEISEYLVEDIYLSKGRILLSDNGKMLMCRFSVRLTEQFEKISKGDKISAKVEYKKRRKVPIVTPL